MKTQAPIVWDFLRKISDQKEICGVVEYYDENGQSIFLNEGNIITEYGKVDKGNWKEMKYKKAEIEKDNYKQIRIDHPANQVIYFSAVSDAGLDFKRYIYAHETGDLVESGTWQKTNDNPIEQVNASVMNFDSDFFESDSTLFQPGSKISVKVSMGNSEPFDLGTAYADEVNFSKTEEQVSISGRNQLGFLLSDTIIGNKRKTIKGNVKECLEKILKIAGVEDYVIYNKPPDKNYEFSFKRDRTLLYCLKFVARRKGAHWKIRELSDGRIIIGPQKWINKNYESTGYFQFEKNHEVFTQQITRRADAAYKKIYIVPENEINSMSKSQMLKLCEEKNIKTVNNSNTKDEIKAAIKDAGFAVTEIIKTLKNYETWNIPKQKIYYEENVKVDTQDELEDYADKLVKEMQYIGITETYDMPFRPQILIGDVAQSYKQGDEQAVTVGIITDITQNFGKEGFRTQFTADSGGEVMQDDQDIISESTSVFGYNRQQGLTDLIKKVR